MLRFYFGLAQWWNAVAKNKGLGPLRFYFRADLGIPAVLSPTTTRLRSNSMQRS